MATPAKPKAKRVGTPRVVPRNGGRKPWKPNDDQRAMIRYLASQGAEQEFIARVVGTSVDTLVKHCRADLNSGVEQVHLEVGAALIKQIQAGNIAAIIWYEKTRRRMKDVSALEIGGVDGKPIEVEHKFSAKEAAERFKQELG
jgi:hypothetical protein